MQTTPPPPRAPAPFAGAVLQAYAARPQIDLRGMRDALEEDGAAASLSGSSRFFRRHGIPARRRLHAAEQGRPDVVEAREAWLAGQFDLDTGHVAFQHARTLSKGDHDGHQHGAAPRTEQGSRPTSPTSWCRRSHRTTR